MDRHSPAGTANEWKGAVSTSAFLKTTSQQSCAFARHTFNSHPVCKAIPQA